MSDFEDEFEYESDGGYSNEQADGCADIENLYYDAEDVRTSNPRKALEMFTDIISRVLPKGKDVTWEFKSLVQTIVLSLRLNEFGCISTRLESTLDLLDSVTRNDATEGILTLLDIFGGASSAPATLIESAYGVMLDRLSAQGQPMFALWFNTAVRLARLYQSHQSGSRDTELDRLLQLMGASCQAADGSDDVMFKGSQLLEVFAIEIQRIAESKPVDMLKRLKILMARCARANSAVANPRSMAVIREHAGKILMGERRYADAYNEFFEAFRAFSDTGNARAKVLLKYAVLANILALSAISPFDSREARAFQMEPEILAMVRLRNAYDQKDLHGLEAVLNDPAFPSFIDPWIESVIPQLVDRIKLQYLEALLPAYRSVKIEKLATMLNLGSSAVQRMVMRLILDRKLAASIEANVVVVGQEQSAQPEIAALAETTAYLGEYAAGLHDELKSTVRTR